MSKKGFHHLSQKKLIRFRPEIKEHTAVEHLLEILNKYGESDWYEFYYRDGIEAFTYFCDDDYRNLQKLLPSISVNNLAKIASILQADNPNHVMIIEELIHMNSVDLYHSIMVTLLNQEFELSEKSISELIINSPKILDQKPTFDQNTYMLVFEKLKNKIPESIKKQIPEKQKKRFTISMSTTKSSISINIADVFPDHIPYVIDLSLISPELKPMTEYIEWKQTNSASGMINIEFSTNILITDLELEVTFI